MNIAVIGAGAMGSLFGALLAESGHAVHLISRDADHIRTIREKGLAIERSGEMRTVAVPGSIQADAAPRADFCLIFVKSPDTAAAADDAARLSGKTGAVLTLQNGLGNAEILAGAVGGGRVVAGTTAHGATLTAPGTIRHAGTGPTVVGMWSGSDIGPARQAAGILNDAGIETTLADDIQTVIWNKLLINVGINAITALTGIKNGALLDLEETRWLSRTAVKEAMAVARAQGIAVNPGAVDRVFQVAEATRDNRSSMGQDVDYRRQTEIDAINGAVVDLAERLEMPAPVNQTLTALVRTLQAHF
jgi:2-dehydropantoate 2-reductase